MYVTVASFIQDYQGEIGSTQKLLDSLTDASLKQQVAPGFRTLGHLAWHLATASDMLPQLGLEFDAVPEGDKPPATAAEIADAYRRATSSLLEAIQRQWTDADLLQERPMFGQPWVTGAALSMFLKHEVHHRGQMTILMRQAGLPVVGVYGPSREEWSAIGMQAPALL